MCSSPAFSAIREPGPLTTDKVLFIAPGTDVPEIIAQLEREGVIESPLIMNTALVVEGNRSKLKAGEYLFHQHASLRDVIDIVVNGRQILHTITIPEGLTSEQVVQRLRDIDVLAGDVREQPQGGHAAAGDLQGVARLVALRPHPQDAGRPEASCSTRCGPAARPICRSAPRTNW